jgi:anti-repressor protein
MSNELITIQNVRAFIDNNGIAQINLEDVSRGLGFTQEKNGVDYVRWDRISQYLGELKFPISGETFTSSIRDTFIPENIFYRLAMKANNETAISFQEKIANEILPSIRKHGMYAKDELLDNPDLMIEVLTQLKKEREEKVALQNKVNQDVPKVLFADAVSASKATILIGELAKLIKQNGIDIGEKRLFKWLRSNKYLISRYGTDYNAPTQKSMELDLFTVKETTITHSDGHITISKTTKATGKAQLYFINKFLNMQKGDYHDSIISN